LGQIAHDGFWADILKAGNTKYKYDDPAIRDDWDRAASAVATEVRKESAAEIARLRRALEEISWIGASDKPVASDTVQICRARSLARAALSEGKNGGKPGHTTKEGSDR
jgi:hypothetical protein